MSNKPELGEVLFEMSDGIEYATMRANDFRDAMLERDHEVERLRASFDAHHLPNLEEGYTCHICGEEHMSTVPPLPDRTSRSQSQTGGQWADLQSETEAIDGDQVL